VLTLQLIGGGLQPAQDRGCQLFRVERAQKPFCVSADGKSFTNAPGERAGWIMPVITIHKKFAGSVNSMINRETITIFLDVSGVIRSSECPAPGN
jgi:hypothetical protein